MTTEQPEPFPVSPLDPSRSDRTAVTMRSLRASGYQRLKPKLDLPAYGFLGELDAELAAELIACLIEREVLKDLYARRTSYAVERFPDDDAAQAELRNAITGGRDGDVAEALRAGWSHLPDWWEFYRTPTSGWGHAAKYVYHRAKDWLEARMADERRQQETARLRHVADGSRRGVIEGAGHSGGRDFAMPGRDPGEQLLAEAERKLFQEVSKRLLSIIDALPPAEREVIRLQRQEFSVAETARVLGVTEDVVTYRRRRGRAMLRALEEDYTEKVCRVRPDVNLWVGRREWRSDHEVPGAGADEVVTEL